jgi:hypothetical protein
MAVTAAEKKMIEKNLDLLFEFEKYVLEHPEITEIPRDAIVFMKLVGNKKIQPVERAMGETASQEGPTAHFRYGEETEPGSFANQGTHFRKCRLVRICSKPLRETFRGVVERRPTCASANRDRLLLTH